MVDFTDLEAAELANSHNPQRIIMTVIQALTSCYDFPPTVKIEDKEIELTGAGWTITLDTLFCVGPKHFEKFLFLIAPPSNGQFALGIMRDFGTIDELPTAFIPEEYLNDVKKILGIIL